VVHVEPVVATCVAPPNSTQTQVKAVVRQMTVTTKIRDVCRYEWYLAVPDHGVYYGCTM
jgi:hypothetical protein